MTAWSPDNPDCDPDYDGVDCELCEPLDGGDPYPYAHCCGCGANGSSERPDCTCQ
ncbi:hypothetical protein OTB20_00935 [Streptomyces sp. H27-H1]|uniref:hypothetical protein n=1 Tax=Streptomyces sp. H27-H1 TaxID=2996461 RepID=UPI00227227B3|nr:hypothetical protein [Streptomyces sp. H27-H1]MCY0924804.1 hypothetical protein [Streptomyces sp. H27-H1]